MERQALLAAALCLTVWVAYQVAVQRFYPPPPEGTVPEALTEPTPAQGEATQPPPIAAASEDAVPSPASAGVTIPIETDVFSARISALGGRLVSFQLKHFRTAVEEESEPLELIDVAAKASPP